MFLNELITPTNIVTHKIIKEQQGDLEEKEKTLQQYQQDSFDAYLSGKKKEFVSLASELGENVLCGICGLNGFKSLTFENVTHIGSRCGHSINNHNEDLLESQRPTFIFTKPVTIDQDAFEGSMNVNYEFRGGIVEMSPSVFYGAKNVTVKVAGKIPSGAPWDDGGGVNVKVIQYEES